MQFHTDHHFIIGHGHLSDGKPCQDHAQSGIIAAPIGSLNYAYAVVSDGCSSAGQTDIGSRLLTAATVKTLLTVNKDTLSAPYLIATLTEGTARSAAELLGLTTHDLFATQLYAVVDNLGHGFASIYGDGALAFVHADGTLVVYLYEWANNRPFYPAYNSGNRETFINSHGGPDTFGLKEIVYTVPPIGDDIQVAVRDIPTAMGANGSTILFNAATDNLALICLFTDGILQVNNYSLLDTLKALVGFKNLSGEFVKRRLIRFLKDSKQKGLGPIDDLGYAVIVVDREQDE